MRCFSTRQNDLVETTRPALHDFHPPCRFRQARRRRKARRHRPQEILRRRTHARRRERRWPVAGPAGGSPRPQCAETRASRDVVLNVVYLFVSTSVGGTRAHGFNYAFATSEWQKNNLWNYYATYLFYYVYNRHPWVSEWEWERCEGMDR